MDNQITYPIAKSERRKWDKHKLCTPTYMSFYKGKNFIPTRTYGGVSSFLVGIAIVGVMGSQTKKKKKKNKFQTYNIMNVHNRP